MSVWRIQLLGGLVATRGTDAIAHFPSRPVAMLLARLALEPQRRHAREEIIELLWPGVELDVGRNRLRQTLSTLRRLVEPPGVPPDSVLVADRQTVGLSAQAVSCDAREFERLLRQGAVSQALECYRGDLLPGYFDEWVEDERARLSALHAGAMLRDSRARDAAAPAGADRPPVDATAGEGENAERPRFRNLPSCLGAFFGRERDMRGIFEALAQHRLVTVAGLGGFGKTRLAVESARAATGFDAVAFVGLGECSDADLIAGHIRSALQMAASQEDTLAQLCAFLRDDDVLLVLDNFEQLVDDGTRVVVQLLERLPRLRVLVTSRRVLDVPGERVLTIEPLAVPRTAMTAAEAMTLASVALFIDRARGARADFALTDDNRDAVIRLCRALEGLPLAIEIAASRIRSYSPAEMFDALAERFALLKRQGLRATRYGRHASLELAIEWSWHLLSPAQRQFFAALSVFRGGWTADAAEAVCGGANARGELEALVADSLLRADPDDSGILRFSMLETLREFAQDRLETDVRELRSRHRRYFLDMARNAANAESPIVEREHANLKQALLTAVEDSEPASALELGWELRPYWEASGTLPDELRLLEQAVADCPRDEPGLHAGLNLLAHLTLFAADSEKALGYARRAVREAAGASVRRARALVTLARVQWEREQRERVVLSSLDEALTLAADAKETEIEADALRVKGLVALKHGEEDADYATANVLFERAEALYRAMDRSRSAHRVRLSRSACLSGLGRYDDARQVLAECERYFERLDSVADLISVANLTGFLESLQKRWPEAVAAGRRCVRLAWDRHSHLPLAMALLNLPSPLLRLGDAEVAARLMPFAAHFWKRSIGPLSPSDLSAVRSVRQRAAKALGPERLRKLWAEGGRMTLSEAVRLALAG